jgi:hypothetical protein
VIISRARKRKINFRLPKAAALVSIVVLKCGKRSSSAAAAVLDMLRRVVSWQQCWFSEMNAKLCAYRVAKLILTVKSGLNLFLSLFLIFPSFLHDLTLISQK